MVAFVNAGLSLIHKDRASPGVKKQQEAPPQDPIELPPVDLPKDFIDRLKTPGPGQATRASGKEQQEKLLPPGPIELPRDIIDRRHPGEINGVAQQPALPQDPEPGNPPENPDPENPPLDPNPIDLPPGLIPKDPEPENPQGSDRKKGSGAKK